MYLEYTEAEQKKIAEIVENSKPEREALKKALNELLNNPDANREERQKVLVQQQAVIERLEAEVQAYLDKIQRKHFKPIKEAGTEAIIANAKEQIPLILEQLHKDTEERYSKIAPAALKELKIGTNKDGTLYISANIATTILKEELQLHLQALADNKPALQGLLENIIEAVENSPYTDNEEIIEPAAPIDLMRYRRNPLSDIPSFGILNDKTGARLLQDEDSIFQQKTDGQLTLKWAVNQAAKNREAVPVYMALTYEGNDYRVTKKLTGYDKQVYEAVATRFHYWNEENPQKPLYISPQEIWRTMNGKRSGDSKVSNPSKKQVQRICDSLDKMRFTRFYMDITKEISAFNLSIDDDRISGGFIETYVLNSSKVEFTTDKGNTVQGYRIGEEPILYTYNKVKNHVLYVPYEMLDTSQYTSDSENVAEFKGYLLQQIQLMKNAAEQGKKGNYFKRNSIILLETIYKGTGILTPEERIEGKDYKTEASKQKEIRRFRQADRQKIEGLLDAWKAKGWIKDDTVLNAKNEPIREKQQAKGYDITL